MTNLTFKKPECVQLLSQLKSTVDELLTSCQIDVLNVYGGLERLLTSIHPIISHQYKYIKDVNKQDVDVWPFLLEIFVTKSSHFHIIQTVEKTGGSNRCITWIEKSLKSYNLSQQLSMVLEHQDIVKKYYNDGCFFLQSQFTSALLTCLRAVELNDSTLLAEVNPLKLASENSSEESSSRKNSFVLSCDCDEKVNENASESSNHLSLPGTSSSESTKDNQNNFRYSDDNTLVESIALTSDHDGAVEKFTTPAESQYIIPNGFCKKSDLRNSILPNSDVKPARETSEKDEDSNTKHSEQSFSENKMRAPNHGRSSSDIGVFHKSRPEEVMAHETRSENKLDFNKGKKTHQRSSSYFFKQPKEGQSLISFFMSHNFNSCTDLDRENAHFNFAETLLGVIEQVKWNQTINSREVHDDKQDESFMQRVRIRKRIGMKQSMTESKLDSEDSLSSASDESLHGDEVDDSSLSEFSQSNLQVMREEGVSLSLASLYSDADFRTSNRKEVPNCSEPARAEDMGKNSSTLSADIIAINLLKKFSNQTLPNASDIDWPSMSDCMLPGKITESAFKVEEYEESDLKQLRGSHEWAPPRPQIIATIHERPKLLDGLKRQNNRCAGCGSKVDRSSAKRYIFCEYLGKFFCPCCHNKNKSLIPARILGKWDFSLHFVSHFAYDFLTRNRQEPWFHVTPELYDKVSILVQIKQCRVQLHYLRQFIQVCRSKTRPKEIFDCPSHWFSSMNNIDSFSIEELELTKKKLFLPILQEKVDTCLYHIKECILCQARGFICEVCKKSDEILFPFDLQRVAMCHSCKASFHKQCFNPNSCPKCARLLLRKKNQSST